MTAPLWTGLAIEGGGTAKHGPPRRSLEERFWERVSRGESDECWQWTGTKIPKGYGKISSGGHAGQTLLTHRVAWVLTNGPIPDGLFVCHRCDNPSCVNPHHLFLGTASDNMQDMHQKGRKGAGPRGDAVQHTAKLTREQRDCIRRTYRHGVRGYGAPALARKFGVVPTTIRSLVRGLCWQSDGQERGQP